MYSKDEMDQGEIEIWSNDGTKLDHAEDTDGHQYVTIVNLTPYSFVHTTGPEPYQFARWEFGDIPSGKARKNEATYDTSLKIGSFVDTNGYANYKLEGTDKTFTVHVTTHIPDASGYERRVVFDLGGMNMGWRELGFPGERVSVALIIAGSENYGYINSLQLNNFAWMRAMYDIIKDRQLRHVIVPGAHDAGANRISGLQSGWIGGGISANTQTQTLNHYDQLRAGTRYFDMRIVSVRNGNFWAAHVSGETNQSPVGATGESLDDMMTGINKFTSNYPGEVIVWYVRYMTDLDAGKVTSSARYWSPEKANEFYTKLNQINNRCPDLPSRPQFDRQPMKLFMNLNQGRGCVLIMTDGRLREGIPVDRTGSGIYHGPTYLNRDDYWAEEQYTTQSAPKEVNHMLTEHKRDRLTGGGNGDTTAPTTRRNNYFIMQWQCTPSAVDMTGPPTIQLIATQETNPALYHYAVNKMSPLYFPTVILHDAVGLFHVSDDVSGESMGLNPMMQTLAIGLNLYMVSQNCDINKSKNPLLLARSSSSSTNMKSTSSRGGGLETFTGVIFANGTVLDSPPRDFCRTCTYNDTSAVDHPQRY